MEKEVVENTASDEQSLVNDLIEKASEKAAVKAAEIAEANFEKKFRNQLLNVKAHAGNVVEEKDGKNVREWLYYTVKSQSTKNRKEADYAYDLLNDKYDQKNLNDMVMKGQTFGVAGDGGNVTPYEYLPELIGYQNFGSAVRAGNGGATVREIPAVHNPFKIPVLNQTQTDGTANAGGLELAVVAEESTGEDKAVFLQKSITLKNCRVGVPVSNELLTYSSPSMTEILKDCFGRSWASFIDKSVIASNGLGSGTSLIGHAGAVTIPRTTNATVVIGDIANMYARFTGNENTSVWLCHPTAYAKILQLASGNGQLVWEKDWSGKPSPYLFGIELRKSHFNSTLNTEGDLILVDLHDVLMPTAQQFIVEFSDHYKFGNDQGYFRGKTLIGCDYSYSAPFTLPDGTTTVGSLVVLDTVAT